MVMWESDARSKNTTLGEEICVGRRHARMGEAPGKELGYTPAFLAKSAQAIETKGDAFLLFGKRAKERAKTGSSGYATAGKFV